MRRLVAALVVGVAFATFATGCNGGFGVCNKSHYGSNEGRYKHGHGDIGCNTPERTRRHVRMMHGRG